jgi:hypothetical protein
LNWKQAIDFFEEDVTLPIRIARHQVGGSAEKRHLFAVGKEQG